MPTRSVCHHVIIGWGHWHGDNAQIEELQFTTPDEGNGIDARFLLPSRDRSRRGTVMSPDDGTNQRYAFAVTGKTMQISFHPAVGTIWGLK